MAAAEKPPDSGDEEQAVNKDTFFLGGALKALLSSVDKRETKIRPLPQRTALLE